MTRVQKPRPGDFSGVWPLLSARGRVLVQDVVREFAQASAARIRIDVDSAIDRNPHLSPAQRVELKTVLALLQDRA